MNKLYIRARSVARQLGLQRLYYKLLPSRSYEEKFHKAILESLKAGDIVWDVGANDGFYSKMFSEKTGAGGRVFTFEPTPESHAKLCRLTGAFPWVRNELLAFGDFDGTSLFITSEAHRRNHLQWKAGETAGNNSLQVQVKRGDSYWVSSGTTPNVIKIDVEGFEEEVLAGMDRLLTAPELRAVFVEVHFQILEARGRADAPIRIEKFLRSKGLTIKWIDASHFATQRAST